MYQLVHMLPFLSSSNNMVFIVYPLHNYIKIKQKSSSHHINSNYSQATGPKGEAVTEQPAKRPKTSTASDVAKLASPQSSDADIGMSSSQAEPAVDKNKQLANSVFQSPKPSTPRKPHEPAGLKQSIQPLVPVNRYKLDNRPTAFRIIPPLPVGLANVSLYLCLMCLYLLKDSFALAPHVRIVGIWIKKNVYVCVCGGWGGGG